MCAFFSGNAKRVTFTGNTIADTGNNVEGDEMRRAFKESPYTWYPIKYTSYVGKQYLIGRMAAEYAVLNKIFAEITNSSPTFEPHSLFDFGSGIGTVSW